MKTGITSVILLSAILATSPAVGKGCLRGAAAGALAGIMPTIMR